jgi:twitching motility protein PilT
VSQDDPAPLARLLTRLKELGGSDLHLKPMRAPLVRLRGDLTELEKDPLDPGTIERMLLAIVPQRLLPALERERAVEFGYGLPGVGRLRAAVYYQRGTLAAVFRQLPFDFPTLESWGLPEVLAELTRPPQGLVLITGPTGSGKSSTLAAMMRLVAETRPVHVVTIEDPIEFLIPDGMASVSQREIGTDTPSFSAALRNALRQDPDVIMVGEMRDDETVHTVLAAAETGHLVFSTLHTNSAAQTVDRIVNGFSGGAPEQVRQQLAAVLEAAVSLQLVPRADGRGMVAAVEIMRRTPQISKLIQRGDFEALREEIEHSVVFERMQSMNQSLASLVIHGTITLQAALEASANPADLDLMIRKVVGSVGGAGSERGDEMAECTSDFSKILALTEIKKLYEELQERHEREMASRDADLDELKRRLVELADRGAEEAQQSRVSELEATNGRLSEQLATLKAEYEAKLERFNARLRELKAQTTSEAAQPAEAARRGLFRR